MELEDAIKVKLAGLGIKQNDLANALDVHQSQISNALNGRNERVLNQILDYLVSEKDVIMSDLLPDEKTQLQDMNDRMRAMELQLKEIMSILQRIQSENKE